MIYQGNARHPVTDIVVHCSATGTSWMPNARTSAKVAEIRLWHTRDRGWKDIGYHWIIDRDGTIAKGRAETVIGAHVGPSPRTPAGRNRGSIGICLIGGASSTERDNFAQNFTREQDAALRKLIKDIQGRTKITRISGHNEFDAKACPGFNVTKWLKG